MVRNISCSIVPNKFGVLWYRVVLFSFLLTITFSVLSLFAEQGDASELSSANISMFPIATTSGREFAFSAAFDGTNYLVGIQGDQKDHADITAQLVSQTGASVGSRISVPRTGDITTFVAFDGNNYLMVWADDATYFIYGQRIDHSGILVGGQFPIGDLSPSPNGDIEGLVFGGGNYLVTYQREPGGQESDSKMCGRIVSTSGDVGNEIFISSESGDYGFNNVAFDGTNFLVVWCDAVNHSEVKGRFVSPTGTLGTEFTINASPAPSNNTCSVFFNGTNYLAVWTDETDTTSGEWGVFGQLIDKSGNLVAGVIDISSPPGKNLFWPFIAFDGTNYLVTWSDMTDTTNWDIYGQYISNSGTLVGSSFPVDTDSGNQFGGFIGLAVNGKLFGIVDNLDTIDGKIGDVYGMFLSVGSATSPTPTPTTTVTPTPTTSPVPTPQVSPSPSNEGIVFGIVNDQDELPLKGVTITITGKNSSDGTETDEDGYYEFRGLSKGNYTLTYEKEGYQTQTQDISLNEGEVKDLGTVTMEQVVKGKISGYVANIKGDPIESVRLKLKGIKTKVIKTASSDADGFFEFTDLDADTYVIFAKKKGYKKTQQKVVLGDGDSTEIEIEMKKTSKRIKGLLLEEDIQ